MTSSSRSVLKSTSLIGGSQVITIFLGLIRSKLVALLLGPTGTGLIAALTSGSILIQNFAGLGIGNSAVRNIAQARTANDKDELAKTAITLRRTALFTSVIGLILTLATAPLISRFTFGNEVYTWHVRLLSILVYFNLVRQGQLALVQGLREIKRLALISILGGVSSLVVGIPVIYFIGLDAVSVYLVLIAISQFMVAYFYTNKIQLNKVALSLVETWIRAKSMFKLGFAFMGGALVTTATLYSVNVMVIRYLNIDSAGIYQAAMAVSSMVITIILQAMGKDFYPRLAEVSNMPAEENRIINEQIEIGSILAAPALLLTLVLAPWAIKIFYTSAYLNAIPVLNWLVLGLFMRVVSWPMGYLLISRARAHYFFWSQFFFGVVHLLFVFLLISLEGLEGVGVAFFIVYSLHVIGMYLLINKESGFKWNKTVKRSLLLLSIGFGIAFFVLQYADEILGGAVVTLIALFAAYFALQKVLEILELGSLKELLQMVKGKIKYNARK